MPTDPSPPPLPSPALRVRLYRGAHWLQQKLDALSKAVFTGFWLGLLRERDMDWIDEQYYRQFNRVYQQPHYNDQGFFAFEERFVKTECAAARRVVVVGAGAGRELLALHRAGIAADGFECNPYMAELGNRRLAAQHCPARITATPRNLCPAGAADYDAAIIGWGVMLYIQGRSHRQALLTSLRKRLNPGAPVLMSYHLRPAGSRRLQWTVRIANGLRWIRRAPKAELGDDLVYQFVHYFTEEELQAELLAAGFVEPRFSQQDFCHAIAYAPK